MQYGDWILEKLETLRGTLRDHERDIRANTERSTKNDTRLKAVEDVITRAKGWAQIAVVIGILALNLGRDQTIDLIKALLAAKGHP